MAESSATAPRVIRIVLSGGPSGGKSNALGVLTERLQGTGWRVFQVPEAATMLLRGGHSFARLDRDQQYDFQKTLLHLMLKLEDSFCELAHSSRENCVVLCDRGAMDARSFMPPDEWEQLMKEMGTSTMQLRDTRYDTVVHLVTAANGARSFYSIEGHAARSESADEACAQDERIKTNWIGHPSLHIIDNSTDFAGKLTRVLEAIAPTLGLPRDVGVRKRKFLLDLSAKEMLPFPTGLVVHSFLVENTYIVPFQQTPMDAMYQLRLCRRTRVGDDVATQSTYSSTLRYPSLHGQRLELKRMLSERRYSEMLLHRDPERSTIQKRRYSFLWQDRYFKIDVFVTSDTKTDCQTQTSPRIMALAELYGRADESEASLVALMPGWLPVVREVTDSHAHSMYTLAKHKQQIIVD